MQLIVNDEKTLRLPCEKVKVAEGREIARSLWFWLERNNKKAGKPLKPYENKTDSQGRVHINPGRPMAGVGIAAPQLGVAKRVAVIRPAGRPFVFVNPRVVACSDSIIPWKEGCLSFPNKEVETYRRVWVEVECDNWNEPVRFGPQSPDDWTSSNLLESVCAQHEISHLYQMLFFDFASKDAPSPLEWK